MSAQPALVLVHGLWMSGWAMQPMRAYLARGGFDARAFSYPSMRLDLAGNAEALASLARSLPHPVVHLVGHSLGGLVVLEALCRGNLPPGRAVLLGPPVIASHSARRLAQLPGGTRLLGRCLPGWYERRSAPQLGGREVGVLAGCHSLGLGRVVAPSLPRPNDGAVAVEETRLAGAADHLVLPVSHSAMLLSIPVMRQARHFLENGRFQRGGE